MTWHDIRNCNKPLTNETIGLWEFTCSSGNWPDAGTNISSPCHQDFCSSPHKSTDIPVPARSRLVAGISRDTAVRQGAARVMQWHITISGSHILDGFIDLWETNHINYIPNWMNGSRAMDKPYFILLCSSFTTRKEPKSMTNRLHYCYWNCYFNVIFMTNLGDCYNSHKM